MLGEQIIARHGKLQSGKDVVSEVWRSCYDYSYPLRGSPLAHRNQADGLANLTHANTKKAELLDSTSTDACRILASALVSGMTPANSRWLGPPQDQLNGVQKRWLEQAADYTWQNIHAGNYDATVFEAMLDVVVAGMTALFVDEGPSGLTFESWPLAECCFSSSTMGGPIDTAYREVVLTAEQAVQEYGETMVPESIRVKANSQDKDTPFTFVRAIYPRGTNGRFARNMPIASVHVEKQTKKVVRESGYHEMPLIVPRWLRIPGSVYALGPMYDALPDTKTLNEATKYVLANMDLATAGMWGAVDDGVLSPKTVRIGPRKIVVMASKDSMWPLQPASQFDAAFLQIEKLQGQIRKVLMANHLEPQDKPDMTATEVHVRVEMLRQLLGPVYGRLFAEYVQPLIKRCFGILYRAGVFGPAPQGLSGPEFEYISPLARAQRAVDISAMDRYEASLGAQMAAGLTDAVDVYDWDAARRKRAELLGVPGDLVPDQDKVEENRAAKQQAQSEGQMQAAALQKLLEAA